MRLCDMAKGYLNGGCPPASVSGGKTESGSCASRPGFLGPNSCSLTPVCVPALVCCAAARMGRLAAATSAAEVLPKNDRRLAPFVLNVSSCSFMLSSVCCNPSQVLSKRLLLKNVESAANGRWHVAHISDSGELDACRVPITVESYSCFVSAIYFDQASR